MGICFSKSVPGYIGQYHLYVFGKDKISAIEKGPGLGGPEQQKTGPRREAKGECAGMPGKIDYVLDILDKGVGNLNPRGELLEG